MSTHKWNSISSSAWPGKIFFNTKIDIFTQKWSILLCHYHKEMDNFTRKWTFSYVAQFLFKRSPQSNFYLPQLNFVLLQLNYFPLQLNYFSLEIEFFIFLAKCENGRVKIGIFVWERAASRLTMREQQIKGIFGAIRRKHCFHFNARWANVTTSAHAKG